MTHTVTVARSAEQVEQLRPLWETLPLRNAEAELDYFMTVSATAPEPAEPYIVVVERDGRPPLAAVARLGRRTLETKVGYRVVHSPSVRALCVVYSGTVNVADEDDARLLLHELRGALRRDEADVLIFDKLPVESPLYRVARSIPTAACRDHIPVAMPRSEVAVPDSLQEFLAARSRNTRENVKRYGKKLEKAYGERMVIKRYSAPEEVDEACRAFESVAVLAYQRALGAGFMDDERTRALFKMGARRGWFRGWTLEIDGRPVAFWYGWAFAGSFFIGSPGYDPEFSDARVGQYVQMRMMEDLCADPEIKRLDYGFGDAQYKRSFGDHRWEEADVLVFARRPRPLGINATRTAVVAGTLAARRALGEERVAALKKRARRSRAAAAA